MDNDDELDAIRRRKIQEMQRNAAEDQMAAEQQKAAEVEKARRQQILRQILSPEARERLSRVRLVRADLAENVENQLIQLAGSGRINRVISDEELRDILERLSGAKKETKIEWRYK
jgi:programmed cell death protein 5